MLRPPDAAVKSLIFLGAAVKSFLGSVLSAAWGSAAIPKGPGTGPPAGQPTLQAPVSLRPREGKTRVQVASPVGYKPLTPCPRLTQVSDYRQRSEAPNPEDSGSQK